MQAVTLSPSGRHLRRSRRRSSLALTGTLDRSTPPRAPPRRWMTRTRVVHLSPRTPVTAPRVRRAAPPFGLVEFGVAGPRSELARFHGYPPPRKRQLLPPRRNPTPLPRQQALVAGESLRVCRLRCTRTGPWR